MRGLRGLIVAAAVTATLVGCGDSGSKGTTTTSETTTTTTTSKAPAPSGALNVTDIEKRIAAELTEPKGGPEPKNLIVDAVVKCPTDVEGTAGATFDCALSAKTGPDSARPGLPMTGTATVTLNDAAGKVYFFNYNISGGGLSFGGGVSGP